MKNDAPIWHTRTSLGAWDPEGCLICVINDPVRAQWAMAALLADGFSSEHLHLFLTAEVIALRRGLHHQSWPKRVFFFLANLSDDAAFEAEYGAEAQHGHPIVSVYAPEEERRSRARDLLQEYGAHTFKYYGAWVVRGFD